jgi:hypothetical protein
MDEQPRDGGLEDGSLQHLDGRIGRDTPVA